MKRLIIFEIVIGIVLIAVVVVAYAAGADPAEQIKLGPYALPLLLVVTLGIIYNIFGAIPDRWKSLITIGTAIGLSLLVLVYKGEPLVFRMIVDYVLYGLMTGAAAIGLYESKRALFNPRG